MLEPMFYISGPRLHAVLCTRIHANTSKQAMSLWVHMQQALSRSPKAVNTMVASLLACGALPAPVMGRRSSGSGCLRDVVQQLP